MGDLTLTKIDMIIPVVEIPRPQGIDFAVSTNQMSAIVIQVKKQEERSLPL